MTITYRGILPKTRKETEKMNKILLSVLCILLVASFALAGCNTPSEGDKTTTEPSVTTDSPGANTTETPNDTETVPDQDTTTSVEETPDVPEIENASVGLEFVSNGDGTCYVSGIGTCADAEIIIPLRSLEGDRVTGIGASAFKDCSKVTAITIPESVTSIGESAFSNTAYYNDESNWENGVLYIGKYLIEVKAELTNSYTIKEGTKSIADFAFANCTALKNVTIPSSVSSICMNSLDSSMWFNYRFEGTVEQFAMLLAPLRKQVNETVQIKITEKNTYRENEKPILKFPNAAANGKIKIGKSYNYYDLILMEYPDFDMNDTINFNLDHKSIQNIGARILILSEFERYYNTTLDATTGLRFQSNRDGTCSIRGVEIYKESGIVIPSKSPTGDCVTSIEKSAFSGCTGLTNITIPDSVTSIENSAFSGCTGLKSITIPDSVTNIGDYTFFGCTGLTSLTIGKNVTSIGDSALEGCTDLTSITYNGTKAEWEAITKVYSWDNSTGNYTVHCTDGDIAKADS